MPRKMLAPFLIAVGLIWPCVSRAQEVKIISDFEDASEVAKWRTYKEASITRARQYATSGKYSLKISFPAVRYPSIRLRPESGLLPDDFTGFRFLLFDIYNPAPKNIPILVQLKDGEGQRYSRGIYLRKVGETEVKISLQHLARILNITKITELVILKGSEREEFEATLYLDNLRLSRTGRPWRTIKRPDEIISFMQKALGIENPRYGVGIETSLRKIYPKRNFVGALVQSVEIEAAKNEFEAAQIVLLALDKDLKDIKVTAGDLISRESGAKISRENITLFFVASVEVPKSRYALGWIPDPLVEIGWKPFEVAAGEAVPIWVTIYVPQDAKAGIYEGKIKIKPANSHEAQIALRLKVWDFAIPKELHLRSSLGYYSRYSKTFHPNIPRKEIDRRYKENLLQHRLQPTKCATNPPYDPYEVYKKGTITYDWKDWNEEVGWLIERGLGSISVDDGRMGHWEGGWPDSDERIGITARAWEEHLAERGWLEYNYVYVWDEPSFEFPRVAEVSAAVHRAAPRLKNLVVTWYPSTNPQWMKDIDIICPRINRIPEDMLAEFKRMGKEVWTYFATPTAGYPLMFAIDAPLLDNRLPPWICWKYGFSGLLYYTIDGFPSGRDPWKEIGKRSFPGRGCAIYPGKDGPANSIRLEALRDGMEDYEYLWVLNERFKNLKERGLAKKHLDLVKISEALLAVPDEIVEAMNIFLPEGEEEKLLHCRRQIAETIEALTKILKE